MDGLQIPQIKQSLIEIAQKHHGDHTLDSIVGARKIHKPQLALVFINPTHRNISTSKAWTGLKAPG